MQPSISMELILTRQVLKLFQTKCSNMTLLPIDGKYLSKPYNPAENGIPIDQEDLILKQSFRSLISSHWKEHPGRPYVIALVRDTDGNSWAYDAAQYNHYVEHFRKDHKHFNAKTNLFAKRVDYFFFRSLVSSEHLTTSEDDNFSLLAKNFTNCTKSANYKVQRGLIAHFLRHHKLSEAADWLHFTIRDFRQN